MKYIKDANGTKLFCKDWSKGRPVVLIHGWPLNSDSWEYQAVRLAENGYRVIAYDRRGFGRSVQTWDGYDYDTMADDLASVMNQLDLKDAAIIGFSMGGGEVSRYMSRHGGDRVKQAGLISSVAPFMLKTDDNPNGVEGEVFENIKNGLRKDRPNFLRTFFNDFYGNGTEGGGVSDEIVDWSMMMALQGSPKATLDCVDAFGRTDFRPDMDAFNVPTLVVHGTADQTVPIETSGQAAADMIKDSIFKKYEGAPHGLTATHKDQLTDDILDFLNQ